MPGPPIYVNSTIAQSFPNALQSDQAQSPRFVIYPTYKLGDRKSGKGKIEKRSFNIQVLNTEWLREWEEAYFILSKKSRILHESVLEQKMGLN